MAMNQTIDSHVAKEHLGFPGNQPLVFIIGGSQGAEPINQHLMAHMGWYKSKTELSVLWQCGEGNLDRYIEYGTPNGRIQVRGFIYEMGMSYSAADIIVARAGALTLSELAIIGKPAILIPLPTAAANHQYHNAVGYARNGAAIVVEQSELESGKLEEAINTLLTSESKRQHMVKQAQIQARPEATKIITESIYNLAGYELDVSEV